MSDFWEKYHQRTEAEGYFRTWLYIFGSFIIPKLHMQIKYVFFLRDIEVPEKDANVKLAVLDRYCQLEEADIEKLREFEGEALVETYRKSFAEGKKCVIARLNGLASAVWITEAPEYLRAKDTYTFVLRDAFTLPAVRGKGLEPMVLRFAAENIMNDSPHKSVRIAINTIFTNRSAIRAVSKSGFRKAGVICQLGKTGVAVFENKNKWSLRVL